MTKKNKKMLIIINILFLITFALSSSIIFSLIKNSMTSDFWTFERSLSEYAYDMDFYKSKTADEIAAMYTDSYYGFDSYAWGVALYNENGEIAAQSGSHIKLTNIDDNDEIIFLDKYFTSEIKEKIISFSKSLISPKSYDIIELKYIENNGKKIPVSFTLVDANDENVTMEIVLSDEKNVITTNNRSFRTILIDLVDLDEKSYLHKSYNYIYDLLSKEDTKEDAKETFKTKSGGGWRGSEEMRESYYIDLSDGQYVLVISAVFHPVIETFKSETFRSVMIEQSAIFIIFYLAAVISLSKYFKKKKKLDEAKIAFTSAAAHELKTPLAIIENQCECIMENVAPEKNSEYIKSIYSESLRMNKLVATLLQYNRLASTESIAKEKCDLIDIINSEIEKYSSLIKDKNITLKKHIACDTAIIKCNKDLIALVIDNYISNAIKNTENGNRIEIRLCNESNGYMLTVFNEGKGIDNKYKDNLWDIFYKKDESRNRDDNSTGMGLAICKQILELHNYEYGFVNRHDGVEFYFTT